MKIRSFFIVVALLLGLISSTWAWNAVTFFDGATVADGSANSGVCTYSFPRNYSMSINASSRATTPDADVQNTLVDEMCFYYIKVTGECKLTACIKDMPKTGPNNVPWAGLMIRKDLTVNSAFSSIVWARESNSERLYPYNVQRYGTAERTSMLAGSGYAQFPASPRFQIERIKAPSAGKYITNTYYSSSSEGPLTNTNNYSDPYFPQNSSETIYIGFFVAPGNTSGTPAASAIFDNVQLVTNGVDNVALYNPIHGTGTLTLSPPLTFPQSITPYIFPVSNTAYTLTASPSPVAWTGVITSDENPLGFIVPQDETIRADFAPPSLKVEVIGQGSVNVHHYGTVTSADKSKTFLVGTGGGVNLSVTPEGTCQFAGWEFVNPTKNEDGSYTFTMDNTTTYIRANFSEMANPNYLERTAYNIDGADHDQISRTYSDGMGKKLQAQVLLNDKAAVVLSNTDYDILGRPSKSIKPIPVTKTDKNIDYVFGDIVSLANNYYNGTNGPNADGYAYSETKYKDDDPLNKVKASGSPGKAFSVNEVVGGRPVKSWDFGATGGASAWAGIFDVYGFISNAFLKDADLDGKNADGSTPDVSIPDIISQRPPDEELRYYLIVTKDQNGIYNQQLKDLFGNTLRTWNQTTGISTCHYDKLDRLVNELPPQMENENVVASTYTYDNLGQLTSKFTPDKGLVTYTYDDAGRLWKIQDANMALQSATKPAFALEYTYDDLDRVIATGMHYSTQFDTRTRTIYDYAANIKTLLANSAFPTGPALDDTLSHITNTRGRVVAVISYDNNFVQTSMSLYDDESAYTGKVIDLFSYDDEGRISRKYKSIPGLPMQTVKFGFDFQGNVTADTFVIEGSDEQTITTYDYDVNGKLVGMSRNGKEFVSYTYDDLGKLVSKTFKNGPETDVESVNYNYDICDWVKKINTGGASPMFEENLYYNTDASTTPSAGFKPQYNGNISRAIIDNRATGITGVDAHLDMYYTYDGAYRLTGVHNKGTVSLPEANDDKYDASFGFYKDGRLWEKHEGTGQNSWRRYNYYLGTNKLAGIGDSPKEGDPTHPNYIYDANGNMILDRSKKMVMEYDWRDMPIRFLFYSAIPTSVVSASGVATISSDPSVTLLTEINMMYDASGNRVLKKEIPHQTADCQEPTSAQPQLIITDEVTGATLSMDASGNFKSCKPVQSLGGVVHVGALEIQNTVSMQEALAFSEECLQINSPISQNANIESSVFGSFNIFYIPAGSPGLGLAAITPEGGNISIAGIFSGKNAATGTAYMDGVAVYTWDQLKLSWDLAYVNLAGEGNSKAGNGAFRYYIKDHLGSTRLVLNDDGSVLDATAYLAYGKNISLLTTPAGAADNIREKFTGKEMDEDGKDVSRGISGMSLGYWGARYYDAEIGKWISTDPVDELWDAYSYSGNDPINYYDNKGGNLVLVARAATFVVPVILAAAMNSQMKSKSYISVKSRGFININDPKNSDPKNQALVAIAILSVKVINKLPLDKMNVAYNNIKDILAVSTISSIPYLWTFMNGTEQASINSSIPNGNVGIDPSFDPAAGNNESYTP